MKLDYVPLPRIQRELPGILRGRERFREDLRTIWSPADVDRELIPMLLMNPMGKDHVAALLDSLIAIGADEVADRSTEEAAVRLAEEPDECNVAWSPPHDLMGGDTSSYGYVFGIWFDPADARLGNGRRSSPVWSDLPRWSKYSRLSCLIWTSEVPSQRAIRESVFSAAHRVHVVPFRERVIVRVGENPRGQDEADLPNSVSKRLQPEGGSPSRSRAT